MGGIGIVGTGISGLHLALFLQQHGVETTVYTAQTPEEMRAGRLPNLVARFDHTRRRERALDVDHWTAPEFDCPALHVVVNAEHPLGFRGDLSRPLSFLDFRIYLPALLEDYQARGGEVVIRHLDTAAVVALGRLHELVVVAAGRKTAIDLFPRDPARSPYDQPQRVLCAGVFTGMSFPDGLPGRPGFTFNVSPGAGEVFQSPLNTFGGRASGVMFESIPGGPFEEVANLSYEDDPRRFETTVLALLREHAPVLAERVDASSFGLTRPEDLLQGAITPVVRRAWAPLGDGRFAMAVGDAWVLNDPITGQGANTGSHCARVLGQSIVEAKGFDEAFCRAAEARMWEFAGPVVEWTNAFLRPAPGHLFELVVAAASDKSIADAFADSFDDPPSMWRTVATPEGTAAFIDRHRSADAALTAEPSDITG